MNHRFFKTQPRWLFYALLFTVLVAGIAVAETPPQEFIDLDNKIRTGGCTLWRTFYNIVMLGLFFAAAYAGISFFIGNANIALRYSIYVVLGGVVIILLMAIIRYFGTDPCTTTIQLRDFAYLHAV